MGALSWRIRFGYAGGVELAHLGVVLASRYCDDEPGSPWSYVLYVDEHGDEAQRQALGEIFRGRRGGTALKQFPWAFKPAHLLGVRPAKIEIDHTPGHGWFRAGAPSKRLSDDRAFASACHAEVPSGLRKQWRSRLRVGHHEQASLPALSARPHWTTRERGLRRASIPAIADRSGHVLSAYSGSDWWSDALRARDVQSWFMSSLDDGEVDRLGL